MRRLLMAARDIGVEFDAAWKVAIKEATNGVPFAQRWIRVLAATSDAWRSAYEGVVEIPGADTRFSQHAIR